ncbi:zona pellucida sperm-binding protein 3d.2 isoform X1 [Electrophorus electricus]|uniref:zona pellucida sperm-binding protein 3d.2 isoform X1 n=1 Tax=Electrophorus electricus TaxID=8005 RepID=UPI0015CF88F4|nr:zona pellucida sperm-binding protein 3d.2 isoform X1 [Electrophorus electricus]
MRSVYVLIQCHFNRFHYSYKIGFLPYIETQRLFKPMKTKGSITLTPCDAQWNRLSPSEGYTIGHPMYFEAKVPSVAEGERLFVHSCHVNMNSSLFSMPQVIIIDNYGCIIDSKNNSRSRFIESTKNVVRFSVEAFVFQGSLTKHLYMHCEMSVKSEIPTATSKFCTCNQNKNRWEELYGFNTVCSCCSSTCLYSAPIAFNKTISSESWSMTGEEDAGDGDTAIAWENRLSAVPEWQTNESHVFKEMFGLN